MTAGTAVRIRSRRHTAIGEVLAILRPDQLPHLDIEHAPPAELVELILEDMGVTEIALIGYRLDQRDVMFAALATPKGWYDLKLNRLEMIEEPNASA